jgi:hypothetical protein
MHEYRVVERWPEEGEFALQCSSGRYHVARALNFLPPLHARLHGEKPHLGFTILVCLGSGAIFRLIFESINDAVPAPMIQQTLCRPRVPASNGFSTVGSGD